MIIVRTILTIIIDVIGIKTLLFSFSIRISPGSFPNQLISADAKYRISPIAINIIPPTINQRAITVFFLKNIKRTGFCKKTGSKD